jgi:polyisoprenoid-binding protein YceI
VPARSVVAFSVRYGMRRLEASLDVVKGTMRSDPRWHPLRGLDVLLDGASVRTESPARDERLRHRGVFGASGDTAIRLVGAWSRDAGPGQCHIDGAVELRGERHLVELIATASRVADVGPGARQELTVGVTGRIDFSEWGLPLPVWWTGGGLLLGRSATVAMTLRAVSADPATE